MKRHEACRKIVTENRRTKAKWAEMTKHNKNIEIDKQMKKMADDAQADRVKTHEKDQQTYKQQRRNEKAKKRGLNIEIASEIVDLIMDVAESANDKIEEQLMTKTQRHNNDEYFDSSDEEESELIQKPLWRHWMNLFGDGKKVSEENIVIDEADEQD